MTSPPASAAAVSSPLSATLASPRAPSSRASMPSSPTAAPISVAPRSMIFFRSSRSSASRRKTRLRDRRGAITSNDGFSVVAPMSVTVPSSTCGKTASCWALLKRWISSMKSTVRRPARRWTRASATTLRRSATPAVTADMATRRALVSAASSPASVVLPLPGGPQSTMLGRWPEAVSPLSTSTTRFWPTRLSKLLGRRRVARGAFGSGTAGSWNSSPWSLMTGNSDPGGRMPAVGSCWYCNSELPDGAQYCPSCGHSQSDRTSSPLFGVVDPVTGIWNSQFINALIGQEANQAVRYHRALSVLVVELDHAEHVHKELGHIQLEGLLREISERLGQAIRDTDTVAFLDVEGPPHFAIVLPETDEQGATLAADKIRRSIASHDFATSGNWKRITVSCGAATIDAIPAARDAEAGLMNRREYTGNLLREAFHALEAGRSSGTNRTSVGAFRS